MPALMQKEPVFLIKVGPKKGLGSKKSWGSNYKWREFKGSRHDDKEYVDAYEAATEHTEASVKKDDWNNSYGTQSVNFWAVH
jgi:hypothetical protein